eukprot:CAMPEP_0178427050 /NCGR_PEP_ID=MMETSP0689_2-20121128/29545_1 /TAXON_ID=160604 /ORGANISM="Amphidinium massartii, Strain CS-259" /LENGTH=44 /DNA_ID= /DNA_START= /DNA_END= /DNA_ORIENTATION=
MPGHLYVTSLQKESSRDQNGHMQWPTQEQHQLLCSMACHQPKAP